MLKTYNELYIETRNALREAGVEAAALEARLIVAHASDKTRERLLRDLQLYSSDEVAERVAALTVRRLEGEPVAYITGSWEFYGMPLEITRDVLIPRADTELLVERAAALMRGVNNSARILDLCTGSGCVGCALARELPASRVTLVDSSSAALAVARRNIRLNDLSACVVCLEADVVQPPPLRLGCFDLLVSNPPYVRSAEVPALDRSVAQYEPLIALDGGADGLAFYRAILSGWRVLQKRGGWALFEVGEGQAADVAALMSDAKYTEISTAVDTGGVERVVLGRYEPA